MGRGKGKEYERWLFFNRPHLEMLEPYTGMRNKTLHRCKIHNYEWDGIPVNIKKGDCPICSGKKKNHSVYVNELATYRPHIEALEEYKGWDVKILHRCKIHDYEWEVSPQILKKCNCPVCSGKVRTHALYVNELAISRPHIEALEKYKGINVKILHRCKIHNYEWEVIPGSFINDDIDCPVCSGRVKTHEKYINEMAISHPHLELLEPYKTSNDLHLHRCKIHDYEWEFKPGNLKFRQYCPICSASVGVKAVYQLLRYKGLPRKIEFNPEWLKNRKYDFITDNLIIEYDGKHHFDEKNPYKNYSTLEESIEADLHKTREALNHGYRVLRISYTEEDNIEEHLDMALNSTEKLILCGEEYSRFQGYTELVV